MKHASIKLAWKMNAVTALVLFKMKPRQFTQPSQTLFPWSALSVVWVMLTQNHLVPL